ncbi:MAG: hypothetical protein EAZ99_02970 [Alphaproteobacteria bacterium]|nr:protein phosphatase CheZ [Alphaproteobacteria bacterium]TAD91620.1 MAG: hypothetical protein EAZ99_02970 [Alphaproteobacteria bacterium]
MSGPTRDLADILRLLLRTPQGQALVRERDRFRAILAECGADLNDTPSDDGVAAELRRLTAMVEGLRGQIQGPLPPSRDTSLEVLRRELQEMSAVIVQAKREIAALKPESAQSGNRILSATEELDAIVTATERATTEIITKAERMSEIVDAGEIENSVVAEELSALSMDILMACSFQDITGQRITKVVNVLRYLETRINSMVQIWGQEELSEVQPVDDTSLDDTRPDAHLLNGPQLEGRGNSQVDIDALFQDLRK